MSYSIDYHPEEPNQVRSFVWDHKERHVTPWYHQKVRSGEFLQPLPYHRRVGSHVSHLGFWENQSGEQFPRSALGLGYNNLCEYGIAGASDQVNFVDKKAIRSFYRNADNIDVNLSVSAVEAAKTVAMVNQSARRLAGAIRAIKRFDISELYKSLGMGTGRSYRRANRKANNAKRGRTPFRDYVSSTWLEVMYGWRPVLYEVKGALDAMDASYDLTPYDIRIQGKSSRKLDMAGWHDWWPFAEGGGTNEVMVKYVCYYNVRDPLHQKANDFGLFNLSEVAWELTPYSFVIDQFVPVGDFLRGLTATSGMSFLKGSKTISVKTEGNCKVTRDPYNFGRPCDYWDVVSHAEMQRSIIPNSPDVSRILSAVDLSESLGVGDALTGIALLHRNMLL